jgi:membrane associated rhomboid family serine protease
MIPIPIGDTSKTRHTAWINWLLIFANCAIFSWYWFTPGRYEPTISAYAMVPNQWHNWKTLVTSMFLHGDPMHLLGNMLFLYIAGDNVEDRLGHLLGNALFFWVFGNNIEDSMGHFRFLAFYILCGLVAAAAHVFTQPGSIVPTVGASGAISGVMGAFLVFFPRSNIKFMLWLIIFIRYFTLPAWGVLGFWVFSQVMMARAQWHGVAEKEAAMVAVFAHLGGFAFGFLVAVFARLFGKEPKKRGD